MKGKSYTDINRNDFECGKFKKIKAGGSKFREMERDGILCGASMITDK